MENHLGLVWKREATVLCMNLDDVKNMEQFVSQELKGYTDCHLEAVAYSPSHHQLRLYFNTEKTHVRPKNYVKQVSKAKHPNLEEFLWSQKNIDTMAHLATIEFSEAYLLFFSEYAK